MLCQAANVHIAPMFCDRSWAFLQQLNMKKRGFNISLLLREEMTFTDTIRRRAGLFWKWAWLLKIFFSLKQVSCLSMQNCFCNNMSLCPSVAFHRSEVTCGFMVFLGVGGISFGPNAFWMVGTTNTSIEEKSFFYLIIPIGTSESDTLDC